MYESTQQPVFPSPNAGKYTGQTFILGEKEYLVLDLRTKRTSDGIIEDYLVLDKTASGTTAFEFCFLPSKTVHNIIALGIKDTVSLVPATRHNHTIKGDKTIKLRPRPVLAS
jgi:hypothetical protein